MRKTSVSLALIAALLFAIGFAVPALGGPSLSGINKTAKKALSQAKSASSTANQALSRASTANDTATAALEATLAGPPVVSRQRKDIPAAPNDFARFDVACPAGYSAVGVGLGLGALEPVFFASYGGGALGSMYNPSSSSTYTGSVYVECIKTSGYTVQAASVPRMTKAQALDRVRKAEEDAQAAAAE